MAGTLYLVTTPIGNLEDITLRALETLKKVDMVAAEDTRRTLQLLNHFEIKVRLISYHAFNEHQKTAELLEKVASGLNVALVSDAGTPALADPGFFLARAAIEAGIEPVIIPGVSALTFSVTAAALPVDKFAFYGFAPVKSGRKTAFFEAIKKEDKTVFFFESPFRITKTLEYIVDIIGCDTQIAIIREATKMYEEIIRGKAGEIAAKNLERNWKGEFVVGIYPPNHGGEGNEPD